MNVPQIPWNTSRALVLGLSACLLAACASSPQRPPELVRLESELARLQADPAVASNAAEELAEARRAIDVIARDQRRMKADLLDHNVYLASRLLRIAEAEGRADAADARLQQLGAERERLVAEGRTAEARRARAEAERAQSAAQDALMAAERERSAAEVARAEADQARTEALAARAELEAMQQTLKDLSAKQTERGLVVTLGDVLFEVDRAELKPGSERNLNALVEALRKYEGTTVSIEGHTDSTGAAAYNLALSQRRAEAVQRYLAAQGIEPQRLVARGLGKDYPVASNDSSAGRQQNRRVEIVIQNLDTGTAAQVETAPR